MENFLLNYVEQLAEASDKKLDQDQRCEIVNNLMNNEELWDTIDSFIYDELDNIEGDD